jgi:histidinol-phosphatase (PHP family)
MHTPLCKHAIGEPEAYADVGAVNGLKGIIFTCHNPVPDGWTASVRMDVDELDTYVSMVSRAAEAFSGALDVRLGLESDYLPGMEPWLEDLHGRASFELVLGSVHPHFREYRELFYSGDMEAFQAQYFEHLAMAAESGLFDVLSHPDLVRVVAPNDWNVMRVLTPIRRSLDRIAETGVAMEVNTSGVRKALAELHPCEQILREMHERGIPVVLGSDAHAPERVGDYFLPALVQLLKVGYHEVSHFLGRERHDVPLMDALRSLQAAARANLYDDDDETV